VTFPRERFQRLLGGRTGGHEQQYYSRKNGFHPVKIAEGSDRPKSYYPDKIRLEEVRKLCLAAIFSIIFPF
jgi:hypothetical protein